MDTFETLPRPDDRIEAEHEALPDGGSRCIAAYLVRGDARYPLTGMKLRDGKVIAVCEQISGLHATG